MTIRATCSSCHRTYGVKGEYAGRRIRCPDCGSPVQIPESADPALAEADPFVQDGVGYQEEPAQGVGTRRTEPKAAKSGSSLPVVGIIIGVVVAGFAFVVCAGIITAIVMFDNEPLAAANRADELDRVVARRQVGATREESGRLDFTDDKLESGEYYDEYSIAANRGEVYVIDLYADDFDPYLIVFDESESNDFQLDNDDYGSDTSHSQIVFAAPHTSTYLVAATSFEEGESGRYELTIRNVTPGTTSDSPAREETGVLDEGDDQLDDGEYVDVHILTADEGDLFLIDLHSDEFDTYLFVTGPAGTDFELYNDDLGESNSHSQITMMAPVAGEYEINATSFDPGETGTYRLTIQEL